MTPIVSHGQIRPAVPEDAEAIRDLTRSAYAKWVALIGHVSFVNRDPYLIYGVDKILAALLFILCLAPIGRAMSLDRVRAVHRQARAGRGSA